MLFHMYIEKKIKFIQKYFRNYLNNKSSKIKIQLNYVYNINKILLIQKMWKKLTKARLNKNSENNAESILKKSIPFKLDNFDINNSIDSNIEIKTEENKNENINNNNDNIDLDSNLNINQQIFMNESKTPQDEEKKNDNNKINENDFQLFPDSDDF